MKSIFIDKHTTPSDADLANALAGTYPLWQELAGFTKSLFPSAKNEWHFSGEKYGWSFHISDKKRVILYLLPRDRFFKAAFVFGQKATDHILDSDIAADIKDELRQAKPYAEGRGIRIDVKNKKAISDLKKLIQIKIAH